ncbi:MAG TPA: MFS transporter [Acidobacteriaceae bacterium]
MNDSQQIDIPSRLGRWWTDRAPSGEFWALVVAAFLFNFGVSVFFFLYNLLMLDLGFRERSLGVLASALAFGSMAGTIPMGLAARRFGLKRVLMVCLVLLAAGFVARVFLFWYPAQLTFAFFDGVVLCGWVVALSPAVANVVEERKRPFAFSVLFAVAVATGSLGGFVGGNMPGWCHRLGTRFAGVAVSGVDAKRLTLLLACLLTGMAAWPIQHLRGGAASESVRWGKRPSPFLLRFLLASALWAAVVGAFNPFTNVFFSRYLGVPTAHLGNFFSIAQLVQAAAVLTMPFVLRRTGLISGIMAAQLTAGGMIALLAVSHGVLHAEVLYCGFMAAQHMCDPGLQSLLMDRIEADERSGASALYFLAISVAQAVSAAVAGAAYSRFSYPPVLLAVGGATVIAAGLFRLLCGSHESKAM